MKYTATFFYNDDEGIYLTDSYESVCAESKDKALALFDLMLLDLNADDYQLEESN